MVCPAIADLQFEAPSGGVGTIVRGYLGVAKAISGALLHDLCEDMRILAADAPDLLWVVAMQVCYYASMVALIGGNWFRQFDEAQFIVLVVTIVGMSVIPVVVCFWPDRYPDTTSASQ
jgi:hypothetical protein